MSTKNLPKQYFQFWSLKIFYPSFQWFYSDLKLLALDWKISFWKLIHNFCHVQSHRATENKFLNNFSELPIWCPLGASESALIGWLKPTISSAIYRKIWNENLTCEYSKILSRLVNKFSAWHENLTKTWAFPRSVKHFESVKPIAEGDKLNKSIKVSLFDR